MSDGLRRRALFAYAGPALPLAALTLPAFIYLPTFFAQDLGLGLATVGGVLLAARIWDVISDPLVGIVVDRAGAGSVRGRKVWILVGLPITLISVWFLFIAPSPQGGGYLLGWSLALYLGWTLMILPLMAIGAEWSLDYQQRNRISGFREGAALLGTLAAIGIPAVISWRGNDDTAAHIAAVGWLICLLLPLSVALLWRYVPAPPRRRSITANWHGLASLTKNRPFFRLIVAYFVNGLANGLPATLFLLYVEHVIGAPDRAPLLLLVYFVAGMAGVPVCLRLSKSVSKHRLWAVAMIWTSAIFALVPLLGPGDVWLFAAIAAGTGLGLAADLVLPASIQADVLDVDYLNTGRQRAGLYFGLWGMATKLSLALAVGIAFPLLAAAGFDRDQAESEAGITMLIALYGMAPVALKLLAIALMWRFPIDRSRQDHHRRQMVGDEALASD